MDEMIKWCGVGSRDTPPQVGKIMTLTSLYLSLDPGYLFRSGGAIGADTYFERGWRGPKEIFYAEDATRQALEHAKQHHPNWDFKGYFKKGSIEYVRKLHARNSMIVLGRNLDDPVSFCICWTKSGLLRGGTSQAVRVCKAYNIPVFNIGEPQLYSKALEWLNREGPFYIDLESIIDKQT